MRQRRWLLIRADVAITSESPRVLVPGQTQLLDRTVRREERPHVVLGLVVPQPFAVHRPRGLVVDRCRCRRRRGGRRRFGSRGLGLLSFLLFLLASLARRRVVLGGRRGVRGGGETLFLFLFLFRRLRSASSSVATAASASLRFFAHFVLETAHGLPGGVRAVRCADAVTRSAVAVVYRAGLCTWTVWRR